jgi:hypothetical protein
MVWLCRLSLVQILIFVDDARATLISTGGIHKVIHDLEHTDENVRQAAFDCIKTVYAQGITFKNIIGLDSHLFIFQTAPVAFAKHLK